MFCVGSVVYLLKDDDWVVGDTELGEHFAVGRHKKLVGVVVPRDAHENIQLFTRLLLQANTSTLEVRRKPK